MRKQQDEDDEGEEAAGGEGGQGEGLGNNTHTHARTRSKAGIQAPIDGACRCGCPRLDQLTSLLLHLLLLLLLILFILLAASILVRCASLTRRARFVLCGVGLWGRGYEGEDGRRGEGHVAKKGTRIQTNGVREARRLLPVRGWPPGHATWAQRLSQYLMSTS